MQRRVLWFAGLLGLGAVVPAQADLDLQRAAAYSGVTAAMLTACGVSAGQVANFFDDARGSAELAALLSAQVAAGSAEEALQSVLTTADPFTPPGRDAIGAALDAKAQAVAAFQAAAVAFVERGATHLDGALRDRLAAWRIASTGLPPEFRVVVWSHGETVDLERALLDERVAQATGGVVLPESAVVLTQARGRPEVAAAAQRLVADLGAVSAALEAAVH